MNCIRLIIVLVLVNWMSLSAQELDSLEKDLSYYADALTNLSSGEHREMSAEIFGKRLIDALSIEGSFEHPFGSLEWCQIISPPDSTFRMITWQLELSDNSYRYNGVVQKSDGSIIQLRDKRPLSSEYASFDQNTWYGSLYYGVEEFVNDAGDQLYLILGFNVSSANTNKKVADVLQLVDDGVKFGAEVFVLPGDDGQEEVKSRIVLEYASSASGRMQFDREKKMLIYDHVILINAGFEGPLWVPDGSFHGFAYENGKWVFVEKVFEHTVDQPPGEGLEKNEKDILGRKKN